jgi:glutamine---fructose-6-phosphate transaminase (isomerizing)
MCGIIAIAGRTAVQERLMESLRILEYRGYDSAGLAAIAQSGDLVRTRAVGKLSALRAALEGAPVEGHTGIGHTRWATHGAPSESNAHPHATGRVAIVHNGIVENFAQIRAALIQRGHQFYSETDTEVIVHQIDDFLQAGHDPQTAFALTLRTLRGAFAIAAIFSHEPGLVMGARLGSPLVVGLGNEETILGSDAIAVAPHAKQVIYLREGDWVVARGGEYQVYDVEGKPVTLETQTISASMVLIEKGEYRHFMMKEIHEQSDGISRTLMHFVDPANKKPRPLEGLEFGRTSQLNIVACGTASYAGQVARYWFEDLARLPTQVEIASEFRYRNPALSASGMSLAISQSGETADTKAAFELCKQSGQHCVALINVMESTIGRLADVRLPTLAGPEIGVASTKAFTAQLTALASLVLLAAQQRGTLTAEEIEARVQELVFAPRLIADTIQACDLAMMAISNRLRDSSSALFLGRGPLFPLAVEGALKLKEISYIHAEGFAAGELKHGPIALVDEHTPVIVLSVSGPHEEKTRSSIQEVAARGGPVTLIGDAASLHGLEGICETQIVLPDVPAFIAPIIYAAPMQLLAYYTAVAKGTDVDQPRNLAKSVTVE